MQCSTNVRRSGACSTVTVILASGVTIQKLLSSAILPNSETKLTVPYNEREFLLISIPDWGMMRLPHPPPHLNHSITRASMKDIYEVIRQKEADLQRIQHEIEALRLSAKLLEDAARPSSAAPIQVFNPAAAAKPQTPTQPTSAANAWATAKQFP